MKQSILLTKKTMTLDDTLSLFIEVEYAFIDIPFQGASFSCVFYKMNGFLSDSVRSLDKALPLASTTF